MSIKLIEQCSNLLKGKIDFTEHSHIILKQLVDLAELYGKPLIFTSSYRTPKQNVLCGGSPTSSHLKRLAFDIKCSDSLDRFKLINACLFLGINRIGVYPKFIHIDFDNDKIMEETEKDHE